MPTGLVKAARLAALLAIVSASSSVSGVSTAVAEPISNAPRCGFPELCDLTRHVVARTASRSILGFMNDMASMSARVAAQSGGIAHLGVNELNAFLRRTPYNRDGHVRPIDAARQR